MRKLLYDCLRKKTLYSGNPASIHPGRAIGAPADFVEVSALE
jgi:hypothetical protein